MNKIITIAIVFSMCSLSLGIFTYMERENLLQIVCSRYHNYKYFFCKIVGHRHCDCHKFDLQSEHAIYMYCRSDFNCEHLIVN